MVATDINCVSGGVPVIINHDAAAFSVSAGIYAHSSVHRNLCVAILIAFLATVFTHFNPQLFQLALKLVEHGWADAVPAFNVLHPAP
jgi:hypothetical protein